MSARRKPRKSIDASHRFDRQVIFILVAKRAVRERRNGVVWGVAVMDMSARPVISVSIIVWKGLERSPGERSVQLNRTIKGENQK